MASQWYLNWPAVECFSEPVHYSDNWLIEGKNEVFILALTIPVDNQIGH